MQALRSVVLLVGLLASGNALAQGGVVQAGPVVPGHAAAWGRNGVVTDAGPAGGGSVSPLSELGVVAHGAGTGPSSTNMCDYDGPVTNPGGYHFLCFSANAQGGGLLDYGAAGGAAALPFQFVINGQAIPAVPGSVSGFPQAITTAALSLLSSNFSTAVLRLDTASGAGSPPVIYSPTTSACTLNGGAGDGGSQVPSADGKCWVARFSSASVDARIWGAQCSRGAVWSSPPDATNALQAAANYVSANGGGTVEIPCPLQVLGQVVAGNSLRIMGIGAVFYPGQSDTPGPSVWPPASGPAINCANTAVPCILITGTGVEIDHINFGNPEPPPPLSGTWNPIVYPWVIATQATSGWQGLKIYDDTFTTVSNAIDLEGNSTYGAVYAASQITLAHLWCNACLNTGVRFHDIDNPLMVDHFEFTPAYQLNVASLGAWQRANLIDFDINYAAAPQFSNIDFFVAKSAIQITNGNVTNNFGNLTIGISAGEFTNINFNQVCQAVTMPNGNGTIADFHMIGVHVWGDQSGFQCAKGVALFDMKTNDLRVVLAHMDVYAADTLMNVGCGAACNPGGGAIIRLDDVDVNNYATFTSSANLINAPVGTSISFGTTNMAALRPQPGSTGVIIGPGTDGTTADENPFFVGGGTNSTDGAVGLFTSGNPVQTGYVAYFAAGRQRIGYDGFGSVGTGNAKEADAGAIYLQPEHVTTGSGQLTVDWNAISGLIVTFYGGLPTSCTGLPTGTIYDVNHALYVC